MQCDNAMNANVHIALSNIVNMTAPSINQTLPRIPRTWSRPIFSSFSESRNYMTQDQSIVLAVLHKTQWQTARQIAEHTPFSSQKVAKHLRVLVRLNLAEEDPPHRLLYTEPPKQYRRKQP